MARRLDRIIVVDVEATCWEGPPPDGQENEIIEIGACNLDIASGERADRTCILVRPERSSVSPFCTKLTSLTQAEVDGGVPFAEACAMLKQQFGTKDRLWASYGDYDRRQFEQQCRSQSVTYPFGPTHLNVKNLVALSMGLHHELGMAAALEKLGVPLEGTHHRGVDDAWNIAAILAAVLKKLRA